METMVTENFPKRSYGGKTEHQYYADMSMSNFNHQRMAARCELKTAKRDYAFWNEYVKQNIPEWEEVNELTGQVFVFNPIQERTKALRRALKACVTLTTGI